MGLKRYIRVGLTSLLNRYGFEVMERRSLHERLYDWQLNPQTEASHTGSPVPEEALEYLVPDNPRLKELQDRYSAFNKSVTEPFVWTDCYVNADDMLYFRGDNPYVWQLRGRNMNVLGYALTTYYVRSIDELGLLDKLKEDASFGNYTFSINDRVVSRDLLDSINEFYFLEKHLQVSSAEDLTILDVGAGYGRLAHRVSTALPNIKQYLCTDAFPVSSFLCEYYLGYRGLQEKARMVPLDEIEQALESTRVDIAVNIHCFSECSLSAIEWWISVLSKYQVRYLMVVPNPPELQTNNGIDFGNIIKKHGYKMIARDPKYGDPVVQEYGINPSTHYLFELG